MKGLINLLLPKTLLARTLIRGNLQLLLVVLGAGLGIYMFIDLFDRLDDFLEAGVGASSMAAYFFYRLPFIISQIFPAVFLLALMIQLALMLRSRELLALEACAVSPMKVARTFFVYAVLLSLVQLTFSEVLGVQGHRLADGIWNEQVRKRQNVNRQLEDVWFREHGAIVHMDSVTPAAGVGQGVTVHRLVDGDSGRIQEIVRATSFRSSSEGWTLFNATRTLPDSFTVENATEIDLALQTDVRSFRIVDPKSKLQSLPLWQLGREITRLHDSGSNIERLRTAWHMKIAYACSIVVMSLVALALVSIFGSIFVIVPAGLVLVFGYYVIFVLFVSAGEKGLMPPFLAAWAANFLFAFLAGGRILLGRSFRMTR